MNVCLTISNTYDIYEAACRSDQISTADPVVAYRRFVASLGFNGWQKVPYCDFTWDDGAINRLEVVEHCRDIQREYENELNQPPTDEDPYSVLGVVLPKLGTPNS